VNDETMVVAYSDALNRLFSLPGDDKARRDTESETSGVPSP
jgi:hypothetical protein